MTILTERFLNASGGDSMAALDAACHYIDRLENCVSAGIVRAKPIKQVRAPKIQVAPLGPGVT